MRFKVMPFGMVNSGSTYNRMIRKLLDGSHNLESYVHDVLGHRENRPKRMEILRDFFQRVRKTNLCLRPSKCKTPITLHRPPMVKSFTRGTARAC